MDNKGRDIESGRNGLKVDMGKVKTGDPPSEKRSRKTSHFLVQTHFYNEVYDLLVKKQHEQEGQEVADVTYLQISNKRQNRVIPLQLLLPFHF